MTDHEGMTASLNPRTADPRRHDHEAWVKARRRELRRNRQVLGVIAVLIVAILIEICR